MAGFFATNEHLFSDLDGEAVILSLKNGKYYGLNEVGLSIWTNLQFPTSFEQIRINIMNEYDVDTKLCRQKIVEFLIAMIKEELVEIVND